MTVKVFTTVPGLVLAIGDHGVATNTTPAIVPEAVAAQLENEIRGWRVVELEDAVKARWDFAEVSVHCPGFSKPVRVAYARAETRLRVERAPVQAPAIVVRGAAAPAAEAPKAEATAKPEPAKGEEK
jgi:hypothetical protein